MSMANPLSLPVLQRTTALGMFTSFWIGSISHLRVRLFIGRISGINMTPTRNLSHHPTLRVPNQTDCLSPTDRAVLIRCRCIAIQWAKNHGGYVHAGHIGRIEKGFHRIHRKAQGSLFRDKRIFEKTDGTTTNTDGDSKGHLIRIWRIKDWQAAEEYLREANLELPQIDLV